LDFIIVLLRVLLLPAAGKQAVECIWRTLRIRDMRLSWRQAFARRLFIGESQSQIPLATNNVVSLNYVD